MYEMINVRFAITSSASHRLLITLSILALLSFAPLVHAQQTLGTVRRNDGISVVVFLKKGCPCNVRCMGQLNRLARALKGRVPMEGVVVGASSAADAARYRAGLGAGFALRPDPKGLLAAQAGAACSLDVALVGRDGRAYRLWEGIGKRTVAELETEIAARTGKWAMLDVRGFSDLVQTGCRFGEP